MTCTFGQNIVVCGPPPGVYRRAISFCPVCDRRHRFIIRWNGAWYGTTHYGSCGDKWADGEMYPRPFQRGWRKKEQERFHAMWDAAASVAAYERYVSADRALAVCRARTLRGERKAIRKRRVAQEMILRERAT